MNLNLRINLEAKYSIGAKMSILPKCLTASSKKGEDVKHLLHQNCWSWCRNFTWEGKSASGTRAGQKKQVTLGPEEDEEEEDG